MIMKRILFVVACLVATALCAVAQKYDYQTVDNDPMKTRIYTLANGLKVYLSVNKEKPRTNIYCRPDGFKERPC